MTFTPVFDSFAMNGAAGFAGIHYEEEAGIDVKAERVLGGGFTIARAGAAGRVVKVSGVLRSSSAASLEGLLDNWLDRLLRPGEKVLQLADDRYLSGYADPGPLRYGKGSAGLWIAWSFRFLSRDRYWRGASEQSASTTNSTSSPNALNVTTTGKAPTLPRFEIENTGSAAHSGITVTVRNTTRSEEVRLFSLDLGAGDVLHYKPRDNEIYVAASGGGAPTASSAAPRRVDGGPLTLQNGLNALEFEHTFGAGGDVTFRAKYYNRHHHLGDISP